MKRVDILLVEKGLFESRESAKRAILAHQIYDDAGRLYSKPSMHAEGGTNFVIKGEVCPYVSRGGYKLEKGLREFNISLNGKAMLDIGASTGGFTDCALQHGARKVYAIDVGSSQLHKKLLKDGRVVSMENQNFRELTQDQLEDNVSFASIDVSFVSATYMFENLSKLLDDHGQVVCLIKPQFEVGPKKVGKNGCVNPKYHHEAIEKVIKAALENGLSVRNITYSPIKGDKSGNIEYLAHLRKDKLRDCISNTEIKMIITKAVNSL